MEETTAPHHLRGAILVERRHPPACRHDPAWRNTGLRTAATPRGVANYLASRHRLRRQRRVRAEAPAPGCSPLRSTTPGCSPPLRPVPRPCLTSNLCCLAALSERRGIINPRRGWQPCVAPYFADLGVGDMRGQPMGAPKMPPRRWWQAVIAPHNIHTQHDTHHGGCDSPAPPPGCDLGGTPPRPPRMSPRPRVAKYGATHSCNPSRGSELPRLL